MESPFHLVERGGEAGDANARRGAIWHHWSAPNRSRWSEGFLESRAALHASFIEPSVVHGAGLSGIRNFQRGAFSFCSLVTQRSFPSASHEIASA